MSRDQRRRLLRRLRDASFAVDGGSMSPGLVIGPPVRLYNADWPAYEQRLLAEWNRHREAIMAQPGPRPWAYFWFDVPHAETRPGEARDANLAAGRLTEAEAAMMEQAHSAHAFARVAAARPGQATADWLAEPTLIEATIALVGWNPFSEDVIAHLRQSYRPATATEAPQSGTAPREPLHRSEAARRLAGPGISRSIR